MGDFIQGSEYADTNKEVEKFFDHERVVYLLDFVTERERQVLNLRFGIENGKSHTLAEVSKILNVSRERVRQIEKDALIKLKKYSTQEQQKDLES